MARCPFCKSASWDVPKDTGKEKHKAKTQKQGTRITLKEKRR